MKVFLGMIEVAGMMRQITRQLRNLGYEAYYCDMSGNPYRYYDEDVKQYELDPRVNGDLGKFDVIYAFFGSLTPESVTGDNLIAIKDGKVRFIHHFCGSDARRQSIADEVNPHAPKMKYPEKTVKQTLNIARNINPECTLPSIELMPHVEGYMERITILPRFCDVGKFATPYPDNEKPVVVHAPSHTGIKGTQNVVDAVYNLQKTMDFDFYLVNGFRNEQALEFYKKADIIIDQLRIGDYGNVSIEGMAIGRPVICYMNIHHTSPIINANPKNIESVLRHTLEMSHDERKRIGLSGREYVDYKHNPERNINILTEIFEKQCVSQLA